MLETIIYEFVYSLIKGHLTERYAKIAEQYLNMPYSPSLLTRMRYAFERESDHLREYGFVINRVDVISSLHDPGIVRVTIAEE